MDELKAFLLAGFIFLLLLDFLTVILRSGLFNANLARLVSLRDQEEARVNRVLDILHDRSSLQIGLSLLQTILRFSLAGVIFAMLVTPDKLPYTLWTSLGWLVLTASVVFAVEEAIDRYVAHNPEAWMMRLAPLAGAGKVIFSPLGVLPSRLSWGNSSGQEIYSAAIQDELISLVEAGHQEGMLEQDEREMIHSIFRLGETLAREVMVPRIYVTALEVNIPPDQAVDAMLHSGYSRVPVYEETIDNILGLLYAKDLMRVWREGNQRISLRDLLRPAYFVPEAKKVDELLEEMQARRVHMAIVVDEYGGVAGLVTLEDIVEEIVGEIRDEYDQAEELPFQVVGENEYIFQGRVDLDDFNEIVGSELPRDEADTIGGFIYSRIGRVPGGGEKVQVNDMLLTVEQVSGRRIRKVRAQKVFNTTQADDGNSQTER